jgi:tRNA(His) 5'-end guanylyltransferase
VVAVTLGEFYAFTAALSEEVEFCASCFSASDGSYVNDVRRMDREDSFDTLVAYDASDSESLVYSASPAGYDGSAEELDTGLGAFNDAALHFHDVTYFKIRHFFLEALTFD